jgi:hypothetical protein
VYRLTGEALQRVAATGARSAPLQGGPGARRAHQGK